MVQRNVERIRSMVLDILYYAKDRELTVDDVDLATLVGDLELGLAKKASDLDITLDIEVPAAVGSFPGDVQAIRAMLFNLLENSLDACRSDRRKEGHRIRVAARRMAPWVIIEIEDNGIGMDRETRDRAFSLSSRRRGSRERASAFLSQTRSSTSTAVRSWSIPSPVRDPAS